MDQNDLRAQRLRQIGAKDISAAAASHGMTLRERFQRTMHFQSVDRLPHFEFGYWHETLPAWHVQGLPREIDDEAKAYDFFGIEHWQVAPVNNYLLPEFEYKVLEDDGQHLIVLDNDGVKCQINKDGSSSIPRYLEFPLQGASDWREFKRRLDPSSPGRYPAGWAELAAAWRLRDFPLGINIGSMLGWPRNWMGLEGFAIAFYDEPALMAEIIEYLGDFICAVIEPALRDVQFDFACGWEDVCFKNGPMISPAMFRAHVLPQYKKITSLLRKYGVDVVNTDCDGDISLLVPIFLEGGINCMFPIEVGGGTDPVALRAAYGDRILLWGGIDKMKIQGTKAEIDAELARLAPLAARGGYIPSFDHRCPPTVPYDNYLYYLERKRSILGC